jgi:hypothetical protein
MARIPPVPLKGRLRSVNLLFSSTIFYDVENLLFSRELPYVEECESSYCTTLCIVRLIAALLLGIEERYAKKGQEWHTG